jgi:N-formylglutamate amidohydrolase
MNGPSFELAEAADGRTTSVIFASPHSGRDYPKGFLAASCLDEFSIRSSEDAFVDLLFDAAPLHGSVLLKANAPRAYVDLNRGADELDPAVIDGLRRSGQTARVTSGLGVIPRVVANGRPIYRGKIAWSEAERRLAEVWHPYHTALTVLTRENVLRFGESILIDCHSMPHEAIEAFARSGVSRPEIVLGDRFGSSAAAPVVALVEVAFQRQGFRVARNTPFSGAYVVQQYGRPARHQHAIQVEIDRALYMNELTIRPNAAFDAIRRRISAAIEEVVSIGRIGAVPLAAE